jgi:hypothetical protein
MKRKSGLYFCKSHNRMTPHDWYSDVRTLDLMHCKNKAEHDAWLRAHPNYFKCSLCQDFDRWCQAKSNTEDEDYD